MGQQTKIGENEGGHWLYASGSRNRKKGYKKPHNPRSGKSYSRDYPEGLRRKEE